MPAATRGSRGRRNTAARGATLVEQVIYFEEIARARAPKELTTACGTPPTFSNESGDLYIGYFANRYGEQWIFTCDRATGVASLRGGDVDWSTVSVVRDGRVDGLILNPEEAAWLQACWSAASASRYTLT